MSLLSQFFPSGGGGSNIHVELLALSGGGAAGGGSDSGSSYTCIRTGGGGGGAVYMGRLSIAPGSTVPITVGAGGAVNPSSPCNGARGGDTIVKYPEGTIRVVGGGGGLSSSQNAYSPQSPAHGGTGGGGGCGHVCWTPACGVGYAPCTNVRLAAMGRLTGRSVYAQGAMAAEVWCENFSTQYCGFNLGRWSGPVSMPYGDGSFHGGPAGFYWTCYGTPSNCQMMRASAVGGGAGGAGSLNGACANCTGVIEMGGQGIFSDITGTMCEWGHGGSNTTPVPSAFLNTCANEGHGGNTQGGSNSTNGGSGVVVIKYPTDFAAAPSSPGATDCSPATPGFRTYRFNSSGSITLP